MNDLKIVNCIRFNRFLFHFNSLLSRLMGSEFSLIRADVQNMYKQANKCFLNCENKNELLFYISLLVDLLDNPFGRVWIGKI